MEISKEYLQNIIDAIRRQGEMKGEDRTVQDIARKVDLPGSNYNLFLSGEEKIPENVVTKLFTSYGLKVVHFRSVEHIPYFPEDDEIEEGQKLFPS